MKFPTGFDWKRLVQRGLSITFNNATKPAALRAIDAQKEQIKLSFT